MLLSWYLEQDPVKDRYCFSTFYRSWHGSPSRQDSEILYALARPASTGPGLRVQMHAAIGESLSQVYVTPLIFALLDRSDVP
ncbi:hypothetical protein [Wenzhouxiangella sp. EGI_FJ10305]|uniref:hypothetical protein n=1 Tax=Wenzhouxiangella sp. EGI_FJ10305 TaxID=3243768 RepID=UPI0035E3ADBD